MFTCSFAGNLSQIHSLYLHLLWVNMFTLPQSDLPSTVQTLLFYTQRLQSETCCLVHSASQGSFIILLSQHEWMGHGVECVCGGSLTITLWLVSSVEITMDSNSEGSEGNLSPVKEDVYYGSVARRRIWRSLSSEDQYGMWCSFSPRWQFTYIMPKKDQELLLEICCNIIMVFVLCWPVSGFVELSLGGKTWLGMARLATFPIAEEWIFLPCMYSYTFSPKEPKPTHSSHSPSISRSLSTVPQPSPTSFSLL